MEQIREIFSNRRSLLNFLFLLILVIALPFGIQLIQEQQIFKSQAANEPIVFVEGQCIQNRNGKIVATCSDISLKITSPIGIPQGSSTIYESDDESFNIFVPSVVLAKSEDKAAEKEARKAEKEAEKQAKKQSKGNPDNTVCDPNSFDKKTWTKLDKECDPAVPGKEAEKWLCQATLKYINYGKDKKCGETDEDQVAGKKEDKKLEKEAKKQEKELKKEQKKEEKKDDKDKDKDKNKKRAYTKFIKVAESPQGLIDADEIPYDSEPKIINFSLRDDSPGPKIIFVEFYGEKGKGSSQDQVFSLSTEVYAQSNKTDKAAEKEARKAEKEAEKEQKKLEKEQKKEEKKNGKQKDKDKDKDKNKGKQIVERITASIILVAPDPEITNITCEKSIIGEGLVININGERFGEQRGKVLTEGEGNSETKITAWTDNNISGTLDLPGQSDHLGKTFKVKIFRDDGSLIESSCTVLEDITELPPGTASLALSPPKTQFNKSCEYSVDVLVDTGDSETDGADAVIKYDPGIIKVNSISKGNLYEDYPGNSVDNNSGKLEISALAPTDSSFSGSGILATINFTVNPDTTSSNTQLIFDFDPSNKANSTDSNIVESETAQEVLDTVVNGEYEIGSGSCNGEPPVEELESKVSLGTKVLCRTKIPKEIKNVELTLVDETGKTKPQVDKVSIDPNGVIQGLNFKFKPNTKYSLWLKPRGGLRRKLEVEVMPGTNQVKDFRLPLGDIYPLEGGDGKINTFDKAFLGKKWGIIIPIATEERADLYPDNKINTFDWACMRYDFNQQDEPGPGSGE